MTDFKRICMWSGPRNISTTMMYSFAQRDDTTVYDEPLYAYYLAHTDAHTFHPGAVEVLNSQENDGEKVIQKMLSNESSPVQFYKQMTHHLLNLDRSFLRKTKHVLLTRDPREMLLSYSAVIDSPRLEDTGYVQHAELIKYFKRENIPFTVIDSRRVLEQPEAQLRKLCQQLDIDFQMTMLSWKKGARKEDGVWAKHWYSGVHDSTGFKPYRKKEVLFPNYLQSLLKECMPYYKRIISLAI